MTGQQAPASFNARPFWVLLFFITGLVCGTVALLSGPDWDKLIIAILFFAVGNLSRQIGEYRHRLGLE